MLLTVSCHCSDGRLFLRALSIRPAIPGSGLEIGVLERHLISASSARTSGVHHRRRPLWRWSCWGLLLLLASLQRSLPMGSAISGPPPWLRPGCRRLSGCAINSLCCCASRICCESPEDHRPGPAAGPGAPSAPQVRDTQPLATAAGASRTAEVRSARAACSHRPKAGPAALANSRSPPSPDRIGRSTPAVLLLALLVLAAAPLEAAREEGFANHCGRSRPRVSRCQETETDPTLPEGF